MGPPALTSASTPTHTWPTTPWLTMLWLTPPSCPPLWPPLPLPSTTEPTSQSTDTAMARSATQSKAFGAHAAVVADAPNRLHGADRVVAHAVHAAPYHAAPVVAHAVHAAPAYHAPVVHAAPAYHAPAPAYKPVVHAAPAYHAPVKAGYVADDLAEPSPYTFTYAVADDYSKAAFNQEENNDGNGVVAGSYTVALPDGRT